MPAFRSRKWSGCGLVVALALGWLHGAAAAPVALAQGRPSGAIAVVQRFQEAWGTARVETILPLFADDAVVVDARSGGTHSGRDAVYRWLASQLNQETHIVSGWGHEAEGSSGELVRWNARLSTFSTRSLRAPPVETTMETLVRDGRIVRHTVVVDADSLSRQRSAVRDAFATRTALIEADGPSAGAIPAVPTYPPYQPIALPNADNRRAAPPLPWVAVGAASVACVALALLKRPPRV